MADDRAVADLDVAQAAELLEPHIKALPPFDDSLLPSPRPAAAGPAETFHARPGYIETMSERVSRRTS